MRVAVTGSNGLVGSELVRVLEHGGSEVTRIVRGDSTQAAGAPKGRTVCWDPSAGTIEAAGLEGHDAVVHLAGAGIGDQRWSDDRKATIRDSRVKGTRLLAETLAGLERPPAVLASGSAVGFYGYDRGDEALTEDSGPGGGFLATVVQEWEAATAPAAEAGVRVVLLRSGIVLSAKGGALAQLLLPFKLGAGGRLGSGRQWFSWVSIDDEVGAIAHVLSDGSVRGAVNLTAPEPVTNAELTATLGRVLRRPTVIPVPTTVLRVRFGGEMVTEMLLGGQRVLPAALQASGYRFRHPQLSEALSYVLDR